MAFTVTKRTENRNKVVISVNAKGHEDKKTLVEATTLENATGIAKLSIQNIHYNIELKPEGKDLLRNEEVGFNYQYAFDLGWVGIEHELNASIRGIESQAETLMSQSSIDLTTANVDNQIALNAGFLSDETLKTKATLRDQAYTILQSTGYSYEDAIDYYRKYLIKQDSIAKRSATLTETFYFQGQFSGAEPNTLYDSKETFSDTMNSVYVVGKGLYGGVPDKETPVYPFLSNTSGKILISCGYLVQNYSLSIECNKYSGFN